MGVWRSEEPQLSCESSQCIYGSWDNRVGYVEEHDCKIGEVGERERTCAGGQCHVRQGTIHETWMTECFWHTNP